MRRDGGQCPPYKTAERWWAMPPYNRTDGGQCPPYKTVQRDPIMAKKSTSADANAATATGLKQPKPKVRKRRQVKKGAHGGTVVVLVNDLVHVGKQGDVVEVKPG